MLWLVCACQAEDSALKVVRCVQMVEEGIRASSVPAVLEKCVSDLLDLTDLVRGKLGVQVRWQEPLCS